MSKGKADSKKRFWQVVLGFLSIVVITFGVMEAPVSNADTAKGIKNVVLVHGGFVDGSGWEGVYKILRKDGFTVTIVQNPTLSLEGDVAAGIGALDDDEAGQ